MLVLFLYNIYTHYVKHFIAPTRNGCSRAMIEVSNPLLHTSLFSTVPDVASLDGASKRDHNLINDDGAYKVCFLLQLWCSQEEA